MPRIILTKDGKLHMSFEDYMKIVQICEKIDENTKSKQLYDQKQKLSNKENPPTVSDMIIHDVEGKLPQYFPYLVYYSEVYDNPNPEFKETKNYINHLLRKHVQFEEEKD